MTTLTYNTYTNNFVQRVRSALTQFLKKDSFWLIVGLIGYFSIGCATLRLHHPDEARYSVISLEMWRQHHWAIPHLLGTAFLDKPPLFYYCQMLSIWLLGPTPLALRLPSVLASTLSCWMTFKVTQRCYDRSTGLLATLMLASFPLQFAMSHYANLDMLVASGITITLGAYVMAQNSPQTMGWSTLMFISAALAMLTKGLIALLLPLMVIFCYKLTTRGSERRNPDQRKYPYKIWLGLACLISIVLPWFWWMDRHVPGFSYYYFVVQHFFRYLSHHYNNQQPWWFYIAVLGLGTLPWVFIGLGRILVAFQQPRLRFFLLSALKPILFFSVPASKPIGYILPALPPLAVLTAVGIRHSKLANWRTFWGSLSGLSMLLGSCGLLWGLWQHSHYWVPPSATLTISGLIGLWLYTHHSPIIQRIWLTVLCTMALNLSVITQVPQLPQYSSRHIAEYLVKHPNTLVAFYYDVFFDLIYYAPHQPMLMVDDWQKGIKLGDTIVEQFALGLNLANNPCFIDYQGFQQRWQQAQKPMFMLTNAFYAKQFIQAGYCLLLHEGSRWLLNNQHCAIATDQTAA